MSSNGEHPLAALTCPHCKVGNITMDVMAASQDPSDGFLMNAYCVCRNCRQPSIIILRSSYTSTWPMARENAGVLLNNFYHISVAPPVISATEAAPEFVPEQVSSIFREATVCEAVGCYDAAGAMFRKVLDSATRSLIPDDYQSTDKALPKYISYKTAKDLRLRLDWLFERGLLPSGLSSLVSCVHQDGNDAAHSLDKIGPDAAADLHDFTVSILEELYTTPGRIAANIARREARRGENPSN